MNSIFDILISSNIYVEVFKECMPPVIAAILLYLHYNKRISALETVLWAFATEAYTMLIVGPTFTATFFVSVVFMIDQAHRLFTGETMMRREYLLLLILPGISNLVIFILIQAYKDPFYYPPGKKTDFYIRPLYFYLKSFLPLFAVGAKIVQERQFLSFAFFSATMKKIARFSFVIAFLQIFSQFVLKSETIGEVIGLQHRYLEEASATFFSMRVQALFAEPKVFSAFLCLCIPLFLKDREYRWAILSFIMGVLTISQTFWINMLAGCMTCLVLSMVPSTRARIFGSLGIIIGLFMIVAAFSQYFIKLYAKNQTNTFYQLVFKRSVYRYDNEIWQKSNVVLGMPLQRDMELPVVDFFKDQPYLLLTGYGAGNSTFIPAQYFFGQVNYENRLNGIGGHNLNMRWFYILAEFGVFALICFFIVLTITRPNLPPFEKGYFAFIWVCFFFSQIDLFLIIVAMLCAYEDGEPTKQIT